MYEGEAATCNTASSPTDATTHDVFGRHAPLGGGWIGHVHTPTAVHQGVGFVAVPDQGLFQDTISVSVKIP